MRRTDLSRSGGGRFLAATPAVGEEGGGKLVGIGRGMAKGDDFRLAARLLSAPGMVGTEEGGGKHEGIGRGTGVLEVEEVAAGDDFRLGFTRTRRREALESSS